MPYRASASGALKPTEAEAALSRAETYGTIVIPRDFTKDSLNGRGSTLELIINKSYYAVGTILEVDVKTALAAVMKSAGTIRMTAARGGSLKAESNNLRIASPEVYFLGNTGFNFSAYLLPTLIPGLIALAAGLTFSGVLVREWRDGGATRLLAAANDFASAAILGKLLPWFACAGCSASRACSAGRPQAPSASGSAPR